MVQEIFLTETAAFADVVLPATAFPEKTGTFTNTDRRVQMGRQALPPPGEARQDWEIIQELARRLGLDWSYRQPARRLRRDAPGHAVAGRDHLGAAGARKGPSRTPAPARISPGRTSSSATASRRHRAAACWFPPAWFLPTRFRTPSSP